MRVLAALALTVCLDSLTGQAMAQLQTKSRAPPPNHCDGIETLVGSEKRCLKPKDTFKDCEICPEMIVVPAGAFMMGANENDDEKPVHGVTIASAFAVARFEATFTEWDACKSEGDCKHRPDDWDWGRGNRPVIDVSWDEITREYLPWLSRKSGKQYRLLTEAEWEYAARAGSGAKYMWGDEIGWALANCAGCGSQWDRKQSAPVGSFQANAFGLHDMHGNVWEWVEDCYRDSYGHAPSDGGAAAEEAGCRRVLRGGSWINLPEDLRSAARIRFHRFNRYAYFGFRVARTLTP
jgi:formylglycine-generating enzyme required for sulfatase activity